MMYSSAAELEQAILNKLSYVELGLALPDNLQGISVNELLNAIDKTCAQLSQFPTESNTFCIALLELDALVAEYLDQSEVSVDWENTSRWETFRKKVNDVMLGNYNRAVQSRSLTLDPAI